MASQQHYHHCYRPAVRSAACYCASQCFCAPADYPSCYHPPPLEPHSHFSCTSRLPHPPHPYYVQSDAPNLHKYQHIHEERLIHPTLSSLLHRIASLESSLRRCSSPLSAFHSLRDAAARTIQTHFRAFLLRRSRTLRQLKVLVSIRSRFKALKSSVSGKTRSDYGIVYDEAMSLLVKLDTISGGDPMIRDGRASMIRELYHFLDFIDGVCVERKGISSDMRFGGNKVKGRVLSGERKTRCASYGALKGRKLQELRDLVEKFDKLAEGLNEDESEAIESQNVLARKKGASGSRFGSLGKQQCGFRPKATKSVSFAENGKVYRVLRRDNEPLLEEEYDDIIGGEHLNDAEKVRDDDLCRHSKEVRGVIVEEAEDEEGEETSECGGSLHSSDGEKDPRIKTYYDRK